MESAQALLDTAASAPAEPDLEALVARFVGEIVALCGARGGAASLVDDDGRSLRLVATVGMADLPAHEALARVDGEVAHAARGERTTGIDAGSAARGRAFPEGGPDGAMAVLAVPLTHGGRMLGVCNVFLGREERVPHATQRVLFSMGQLLGLALDNARRARAGLRATLAQERQLLANEVHDSLAQDLYFVKMRMSLLTRSLAERDEARSRQYVDDVDDVVSAAYANLRHLLTHFRSRLHPDGLVPALAAIAERYYDKTGVRLAFENRTSALRLSVEQELQVFHIVNEALANVSRHSGARSARVVLATDGVHCDVTVEDDGAGIPVQAGTRALEGDGTAHFGLRIMRERAGQIGGDVRVERHERHGTRVWLRFPLSIAQAA